MGKIAFIFPGQGAQYIGMGRELAEHYPVAREVFTAADEALSMKLSDIIFDGTDEQLKQTEITQPAIVATSLAFLAVLKQHGLVPDAAAGLSLGEYSALVAAGALSLQDALPLVQKRGQLMQEAVPPGVGGMAAILGLAREKVATVCQLASEVGIVEPANFNAPGQIVIAGELSALRRACELAKEHGARRTVELPVSVSFHCSLLQSVEPLLAAELDKVQIKPVEIPVITNVTAAYVNSTAAIRDALVRQVSHSVLWQDSMEKLIADGFNRFVEVGPGKSLTGLMKKTNTDVWVHQMEDRKTLAAVLEALGAGEGENIAFSQ
ncbi:MAG TPA: ACP S-malonyltransferase [Oscillospiraceae bacterium]|nr:ACP S-malonyltransferase [Oscillospiraceae bacterium]